VNRKIVVAVSLVVAVAGVLALWLLRRASQSEIAQVSGPEGTTSRSEKGAVSNPAERLQGTERKHEWEGSDRQMPPSVAGVYDPSLPQWVEWDRRNLADRHWEWKTPIAFYGKIVDQHGDPVAGAKVSVGWTDLSLRGSSERQLSSDANGLFEITGIRGKHFGVHEIMKPGYIASATNRRGFEYAAFFDKIYHIPDPKNPVIFRMQKKGEAAPLVVSRGDVVVDFGVPVEIPMGGRALTTGGGSPIKVTVFESDSKSDRWRARISIDGGGVLPASEEFPFQAPEDGYLASLDLDQNSAQPPAWQDIHEGGRFYVKTPRGFGLLELRQIGGKRTLYYTVYLNPDTTSRNLEYDPTKRAR
jgi:hypothetical protein